MFFFRVNEALAKKIGKSLFFVNNLKRSGIYIGTTT